MFDLLTGNTSHIPNRPALPIVMTSIIEAILLIVVVVIPVLFVTNQIPQIPTMMAFVAAAPAPPPPPPPPPAPAPPAKAEAAHATPVTTEAAPLEAPARIEPEKVLAAADVGMPGGVEGGVPGGVPGGVVGGIFADVPPPPPPPPPAPAAPRGPVRIGGQLQAPALLKRVEPLYPPLAVRAHLSGVVILEATVDPEGKVVEATVLRSAGPLLDHEALVAVKQWRYSPLLLNGRREAFILTVTLAFNLTEPAAGE